MSTAAQEIALMEHRMNSMEDKIDKVNDKLDMLTSDVDFRLSKDNSLSNSLPLSESKDYKDDTYAYPNNQSEVNTSGGDTQILGVLKNKDNTNESNDLEDNFQTPDSLYKYAKNSLRNLKTKLLKHLEPLESLESYYHLEF